MTTERIRAHVNMTFECLSNGAWLIHDGYDDYGRAKGDAVAFETYEAAEKWALSALRKKARAARDEAEAKSAT